MVGVVQFQLISARQDSRWWVALICGPEDKCVWLVIGPERHVISLQIQQNGGDGWAW